MPRAPQAILHVSVWFLLVFCTDAHHQLAAWQGTSPGSLTVANPTTPWRLDEWVLVAVSVLAWTALAALLHLKRYDGKAAVLLHPGSLLLAVSGLGLALFAFVILALAVRNGCREQSPGQVASLGISLGFAALAMPNFELVILALASPLFLCAPPKMRRANMIAFYLITLSPALVVLLLKAHFLGVPALPRSSGPERPLIEALPLITLLPLGVGRHRGGNAGYTTIFAFAGLALILSGQTPVAWTAALLSIAATIATTDNSAQGTQTISVVLFTLVLYGDQAQFFAHER